MDFERTKEMFLRLIFMVSLWERLKFGHFRVFFCSRLCNLFVFDCFVSDLAVCGSVAFWLMFCGACSFCVGELLLGSMVNRMKCDSVFSSV